VVFECWLVVEVLEWSSRAWVRADKGKVLFVQLPFFHLPVFGGWMNGSFAIQGDVASWDDLLRIPCAEWWLPVIAQPIRWVVTTKDTWKNCIEIEENDNNE